MADVPERVDPRQLRASDADRERIAEVLRTAAAEGRLDLDEVDERLHAVYSSRTYADLEPIIRDLPSPSVRPMPLDGVPPHPGDVVPGEGWAVAVMSSFKRKGGWVPPRLFSCLAFWGGGTVDLREARMLHGEVKIRAFAIMGGIEVIVPEDAEVHVTGLGLMGGFDNEADAPTVRHAAPRIVVSGLAFWGGVVVKRKRRKALGDRD